MLSSYSFRFRDFKGEIKVRLKFASKNVILQ